ncbi:MAG TPA: sensor histidine kinase [Ktedonobacterales bacterium]|nr:sensor histidine kinase [Ktedonobacterales bacterium]
METATVRRVLPRVARPFHSLQWRFSLSYMLVTVLTVLLLPTLYSATSYFVVIRSPDLPRYMAAGLEGYAQFAVPYLTSDPVDRAGLQGWLVDFDSSGRVQGKGSFADLWISGPPYGTSQLAVVDTTGRVVATTSQGEMPVGSLLASRLTPAGQRVLRAALAGDRRQADLATPEVHGRSWIAVPIAVPDHGIGALVMDMDVAATRSTFLPRSAQGLLGFVLLISVGSGLIGLIFGFVISRGMTRRLRRITHAADAWSHGDFSVAARDPSADELGQLARDLDQMADQVRSLLETRQQLAVMEERNRLARDLHDSVKQQMFAVGMQVAAADELAERDPAAAKSHLAEAEQLIGQAKQELNVLIRELRPAALGDQGLVSALRELCADWTRSSGIAATVRAQGERPAALDVEQALFRVAQEALSNVARHSGATAVDVRVAWDTSALSLTIADNGRGFNATQPRGKGVGMGSMAERVEALGGNLLVSSGPTGTRIEARVPLLAEAGTDLGAIPNQTPPAVQEQSEPFQNPAERSEAKTASEAIEKRAGT